jgi:hypothetical protein
VDRRQSHSRDLARNLGQTFFTFTDINMLAVLILIVRRKKVTRSQTKVVCIILLRAYIQVAGAAKSADPGSEPFGGAQEYANARIMT